jgi:hypothetical protein
MKANSLLKLQRELDQFFPTSFEIVLGQVYVFQRHSFSFRYKNIVMLL